MNGRVSPAPEYAKFYRDVGNKVRKLLLTQGECLRLVADTALTLAL